MGLLKAAPPKLVAQLQAAESGFLGTTVRIWHNDQILAPHPPWDRLLMGLPIPCLPHTFYHPPQTPVPTQPLDLQVQGMGHQHTCADLIPLWMALTHFTACSWPAWCNPPRQGVWTALLKWLEGVTDLRSTGTFSVMGHVNSGNELWILADGTCNQLQ